MFRSFFHNSSIDFLAIKFVCLEYVILIRRTIPFFGIFLSVLAKLCFFMS